MPNASRPGDFPGAIAPDRDHDIDAGGVRIAVHEWGAEDADPLFLVHGGFDFARTFDEFAPKLAAAGWRVIAWDQRGHGDSEHAALYSWDGDLRDAMAVMDAITQRPAPVVGHSKGGSLMIQLADAQPFRFSHLVNLDGIPNKRRIPDVSEHERTRMVASEITGWLDHRRTTSTSMRKPGTFEELAHRRARMNPRLSFEWLCHLVSVGRVRVGRRLALEDRRVHALRWFRAVASRVDADAVAGLAHAVPGRARPRAGGDGVGHAAAPRHALHPAGWPPRGARRRRPLRAHRAVRSGGRHGVGVLGQWPVTDLPPHRITTLTHNKVSLALHHLSEGEGRPLLLLHGLGEESPDRVPSWAAAWPGPVVALDFTGHGLSTVPTGGGYSAETVMADADAALAVLGESTIVGRGLGAYVALMLAGARATQVRGAILGDGPGLAGGAIGPTSQSFVTLPPRSTPPDPYALFELSRDLRPPDYATLFVRLAIEGSGIDEPIIVSAVVRPPWLEAVVGEMGVGSAPLVDALATFAAL